MAVNNRTEAQSAVTSDIVATVTNTIHRTLLNDKILNSVVFEKDVISSATPVAGAVTIDYSLRDTATVTTAVNLAVSFSNLQNGAVKYLSITKAATNTVSFVGATDVSARKGYINTVATVVVYRISNKNGNIYVESINIEGQERFSVILSTGAWNMNVSTTHNVSYARPAGKSVIITDVVIFPDFGTNQYSLTKIENSGFVNVITPTLIELARLVGGFFDSPNFSTLANRGYILLEYF